MPETDDDRTGSSSGIDPQQLIIQVHLKEYESTQNILNARLQVEHNIYYLSFILLGGSLTLIGFLLAPQRLLESWIILIIPTPFYLLTLMLFRNDLVIAANAQYYYRDLRKRLCMVGADDTILRRERVIRERTRTGWLNKSLAFARYLTSLSATPVFIVIFFAVESEVGLFEWILVTLNGILFASIVAVVVYQVPKAAEAIVAEPTLV